MIKFDRFKFHPLKKRWNLLDLIINLKDCIKSKSISDNFLIKDISSINYPEKETIIFIEKKNTLLKKKQINSLLIFDDFDNYNN